MDLVHDQRVRGLNVAVLKPPARNAGGNHHHIPRRRFRRGFTFAIDDAGLQRGRAKNRFGNRTDGECFAGARSGHDAEPLPTRGEAPQLLAARAFEKRIEVQADGQFDRLARRARRRDDDDAPGGRLGRDKGVAVLG